MPVGNPIDSVIVSLELSTAKLKSQIAAADKLIKTSLSKAVYPVSINVTNKSLEEARKKIRAHLSGSAVPIAVKATGLPDFRRQIRAGTSNFEAKIKVGVNQGSLNNARRSIAAATTGVASTGNVATATRSAARNAKDLGNNLHLARSNVELLASSIFTVRNVLAALSTLGIFRAFRELSEASKEFETGITNVAKTANLTDAQVEGLERRVLSLARELPIATKELLGIATAAGQLGVQGTDNIARFTKALGLLALATDVQGEEGARQVARIMTLTATPTQDVDRFASALVELGNSAAATEKEILEVATKVAQALTVFKVSSQDVLGISTTLREFGVEAELAGTQVGLTFQALSQAAINSQGQVGKVLTKLGLDAKKFGQTFRTDASDAFQDFLQALSGLNNIQVVSVLKEMGLEGSRNSRVLGPLSQNFTRLKLRIDQANRAFLENVAATREAERFAKTFEGRMTIVGNKLREVTKAIGDDLNPAIAKISEGFASLVATNVNKSVEQLQTVALVIGAIAAAKVPVFFTDILVGLRRLGILRNEQRKMVTDHLAGERSLSASLIRLGLKYGKFASVVGAALGATALVTTRVMSDIAKSINNTPKMSDIIATIPEDALNSWDMFRISVSNLKKLLPITRDEIKAIMDELHRSVDFASIIETISGGLIPKEDIATSQDFKNLLAVGTELGRRFVGALIVAPRIGVLTFFKEMGRLTEEQAKELVELETHLANLVRHGTSGMVPGVIPDAEAEILKRALEPLADTTTNVIDRIVAASEDISRPYEIFEENINKAKEVLEELTREIGFTQKGTLGLGDAFTKMMHDKGLSSFLLMAQDAPATLQELTEALSKQQEVVDSLQAHMDGAAMSGASQEELKTIRQRLEMEQATLKAFQDTREEANAFLGVYNQLRDAAAAAFDARLTQAFNKQMEELQLELMAVRGELGTTDVKTYISLWNEFGRPDNVDQIKRMADEISNLRAEVEFTTKIHDLFVELTQELDQASLATDIVAASFGKLDQKAAETAISLGITRDILEEIAKDPQELAEMFNVIAAIQQGINTKEVQERAADVQATFTNAMRDTSTQIAELTGRHDDWSAAIGITSEDLTELERLTGQLDERTLAFLSTLNLTKGELLANSDAIVLLNERMEQLAEQEKLKELGDAIAGAFGDLSMGIVDSLLNAENALEGFKEAFRNFANQIISEIIRILIVQQLMGAISGAIGGLGGSGTGAPTQGGFGGPRFAKGQVFSYVNGGVPHNEIVNSRRVASLAEFGEKGPEAIMPLVRTRGQLGVRDVATGAILPITRNSTGHLSVDTSALMHMKQFSTGGLFDRSLNSPIVPQMSAGPGASGLAPSITNEYNTTSTNAPMIYIDARGSNGDAAVEAAVQRGIQRAAPSIIQASVNRTREARIRDPLRDRK